MIPLLHNLSTTFVTPSIIKSSSEFPNHFVKREPSGPFSSDNYDILVRWDLMAMPSKKLSEKPLDPVTDDGLAHSCTDSDAESVFSPVVSFTDDDEMGSVNLSPSS